MDPLIEFLGKFLGVTCAVAFLWHLILRKFVLASILSGLSTGLLLAYFDDWEQSTPLWFYAYTVLLEYGLPAIIISLAVGIPFNRHRNPLPKTDHPAEFKPLTSMNQRLSWHHVVLGLAGALFMLLWAIWKPFGT
jgi:hypothetical protein